MNIEHKRNSARRDLFIALAFVAVSLALSTNWDLSERWYEFSHAHESWELDELLVALGLSAGAFGWYSFRRWRESRREVRARIRINRELAEEVEARRTAEALLREASSQLRQASQLAKIGYYVWDTLEDRCAACSVEHAGIFGLSPDEFIDLSAESDGLLELIHPEDRETYRKAREAVRQGVGIEVEYRAVPYDGEIRHVREIAKLVYDDSGNVIQQICTCQDITELRRTERQLRQTQKMEAIGQLTGGIAHDFNNLLAIIVGNAELLKDDLPDEELIDEILKASTSGGELTRRLLAYSRQQPLRPRVIDVAEIAFGMSDLLTRSLGEMYEIETHAMPDLWYATADPEQVRNALLNLVLNARDATPEGGVITVSVANTVLDQASVADDPEAKPGEYVVLSVSDKGMGMTADTQERAFEPFFTTKSFGAGSGLGLSMVYGFASQSGGHVSLSSRVGEGTTVRLFLPRTKEPAPREDIEESLEITKGKGELVLVLEDDDQVRALTAKSVEAMGYRVVTAADPAAAHRALAENGPVDLVLSDVVLEHGATGPQFAREARATNPDLRVIFMSGYAADVDGVEGAPKVLLHKPFRGHELARALRNELDAPTGQGVR